MPQSLTNMPKTAEFAMPGTYIEIQDQKSVGFWGLFNSMLHIIQDSDSDRQSLSEFEEYGISFEAAVEECIRELEHDTDVLLNSIDWYLSIGESVKIADTNESLIPFSESAAGRIIADQLVEKIRSCDNWEQLYDEMDPVSRFSCNMKKRIKEGMRQQCRKA